MPGGIARFTVAGNTDCSPFPVTGAQSARFKHNLIVYLVIGLIQNLIGAGNGSNQACHLPRT